MLHIPQTKKHNNIDCRQKSRKSMTSPENRCYSNTQRHLFFRMSNWNSNNFFIRPLWLFWLMSYIFSEPSNKNGYLNSNLMLRWLCPFKAERTMRNRLHHWKHHICKWHIVMNCRECVLTTYKEQRAIAQVSLLLYRSTGTMR